MSNIKVCQWLYLNRGPLASETTPLPNRAQQQQLPIIVLLIKQTDASGFDTVGRTVASNTRDPETRSNPVIGNYE